MSPLLDLRVVNDNLKIAIAARSARRVLALVQDTPYHQPLQAALDIADDDQNRTLKLLFTAGETAFSVAGNCAHPWEGEVAESVLSTVRAATLAHREFDAGADRTILPDGGESFFLRYLPDGFGPEAREAAILEAATRAVDSSWAALDVAIKEKYEVAEDHLEDVSDLQSWRKSAEHAAILDFQSALRTREVSLDLWLPETQRHHSGGTKLTIDLTIPDEMSDAEAAELVAHLTRIAELAHRRGGGSGLYLDRLEASADVPIRDGVPA
jgi:hypothetical protein